MRKNANANTPSANNAHMFEQFRPLLGGWVRTTHDALLVLRAAQDGMIPMVPRRFSDLEKAQLIHSGALFIFEVTASGIIRWTDGHEWSRSRILHDFLIYRELNPNRPDRSSKGTCKANARAGVRGPSSGRDEKGEAMRELIGSLHDNDDFQKGGLMKKCMTITFDSDTPQQREYHIISYYKPEDVIEGRLLPISKLAIFQGMEPSHEWLDRTQLGYPPKIEHDAYGRRVYLGEADDEPVPNSPSRQMPGLAALSKQRGIAYHTNRIPRNKTGRNMPYPRPLLTSHNSATSVVSANTDATVASASPDGVATPKHMPSLSPTSMSSTLSVTSPAEYAAPQVIPFQYYAAQPVYGSYPNDTSVMLSSLPAIDHSAAPRPSPYYPTAFWPASVAAAEDAKAASMHHLQMIAYEQQAMYGPTHPHTGYAYASAYDANYYQPPHTASSAGRDEDMPLSYAEEVI
ncbi:hypothetical protein CALVIDRAFT_563179 [Calocera viscosa TUFC12733]|uniref:Gti1/Pac2 family-domain-containing protein n=1 Tax=Calocera viscosa (strain TUFC12733) TaxID=1330018 RepID=A0A167N6T6_CALVF|nr:hypothetical protein CALVIDRAFT_563179 [Calocera viscosa TUFC12733]